MLSKEAMIIAILVALILLWATETLGMRRTSTLLGGVIDLGFALLRQQKGCTKNGTALFFCLSAFFIISICNTNRFAEKRINV